MIDIEIIVRFFVGCIGAIIEVLRTPVFRFGTDSAASLWQIMVAIVFLGLVISVFWKGAKG